MKLSLETLLNSTQSVFLFSTENNKISNKLNMIDLVGPRSLYMNLVHKLKFYIVPFSFG